ncbi:DnaJ domain-containing protein [bacterium]|nr:DnaJ domain-containing protein [bacterium]
MSLWRDLVRLAHAAFELPAAGAVAAGPCASGATPSSGSLLLTDARACSPDPGDAGFLAAIIGLGAKLAKVDGAVTDDEIDVFSRVFRTPERDRKTVRRVFDIARQTVLGYESYARQIGRRYRDRPCLLEGVLDGLFHIAKADGAVTVEELDYLSSVADAFGFSKSDFRRIRAAHLGPDQDDPYEVLGVAPGASFDEVRAAYRQLMREHHPDRMASQKSAPKEFERVATDKAAAITTAYARIRAEQGFLLSAD